MRIFLLLLGLGLAGCGGVSYHMPFSAGYDTRSTLVNALPTIVLQPGETRRAMEVIPGVFSHARPPRLASEDPEVVAVLALPARDRVSTIQAKREGRTLVHAGDFPFADPKPGASVIERTRWRESLRRFLSPRPDDEAFRKVSDADLWKTVVRSRSFAAVRIVVEKDRMDAWTVER